MKRVLFLLLAIALGVTAGELLRDNTSFRSALGQFVRRGKLLALVGDRGIYDRDLANSKRTLPSLILEAKLAAVAAQQPVASTAVAHEMDLLHWQFGPRESWSALENFLLRDAVARNLRGRAWLEAQLSREPSPTEQQVRHFYETQPQLFQEPLRLRASHLFLAAPIGYPKEVIALKSALINQLAARLRNGEDFNSLVATYSEDEATKKIGGDLNYFAQERMLPAVFAAAEQLQPGALSPPVRSRLGFHLLRLTDRKPARQLSLAEASPEIADCLTNRDRVVAVAALSGWLDRLTNPRVQSVPR